MGIAHIVLNGLITVGAYALLVFGVFKIYQVANEVAEIKEIVRDIKRNTEDVQPASFGHAQSPEALVRAIHAASLPMPESDPVSGSSNLR